MINQRVMIQIVGDIEYKPSTGLESGFRWGKMGNGYYIQHWQYVPCVNEHGLSDVCAQKGRKWYISRHMTVSEVIQTCLLATLAFEEHEAREGFYFQGARLFGPHIHHQALRTASATKEVRDESTFDRSVAAN